MKAVVMAGGKGTRLIPLKGDRNKHSLLVGGRPMIEHAIATLVQDGITEIMLLLNWKHPESILDILETGWQLGCDIYYRYIREINGPGRQLELAERWINGKNFVLMLGDSLYLERIRFHVAAPHMWVMPLDELDDPRKYGQVRVEGNKVVELRRKPPELFSNLIQTTAWVFPPDAFDRAKRLSRETEGEVHVGMIAEEYVREGKMACTLLPPRSYIDLGTPEALLTAETLLNARGD